MAGNAAKVTEMTIAYQNLFTAVWFVSLLWGYLSLYCFGFLLAS